MDSDTESKPMKFFRPVLSSILYLVPVMLGAQEPLLEGIALYGNNLTHERTILQELDLRIGRPIRFQDLVKERAWLLRQDFLKRIEFQVKPGTIENRQVLMLVVQEKGILSASPILSNNDVFGWYAGIKVAHRNLFGRRNRLETTLQFGSVRHFGITWIYPWFGGSLRLFTELSAYYRSFSYLYTDYTPHFNERDEGIIWSFGRGITRHGRIGLRSGIEGIRVDRPGVTRSGNKDILSSLEPFLEWDFRDWPVYPKTGLYLRYGYQWYGVFQPYRFGRMTADLRIYRPVYHDNILAVQSMVQLSAGGVPVYKRIHMGGGKTLRGYGTGDLAGENNFLVSMEYRFPILYERNPLAGINAGYAGVLFLDTGAAWFRGEALHPHMIRGSVGFGMHMIWDHFVVRLEYGYHGQGMGFVNAGTGVKF